MLSFLAHHGPALLAGATTVLGLGCLAVAAHRGRPLHRKRLGEWTLAAALVWLAGAWLPLPRWTPELSAAGDDRGMPAATMHAAPTLATLDAADRAALDPARALRDTPEPVAPETVPPLLAAWWPAGELSSMASLVGPPLPAPPAAPQPRLADAPSGSATDSGAAPDPAAPSPPAEPGWLARHGAELLAGLFLAGAALGLAWLLLGWLRLRRVLAASIPAPPSLLPLLDDLGGGGLELRLIDGRIGPFCVGVRRPVIVLPARLALDGDRRTLAHVLAHEIAHARQGDGLGRLLCALALPAFWCHPLYWWLRRDLRLSAELLADERAARLSGPRHYARDLLSLASTDLATGRVPIGAPSIFGTPSEFTRRIDMLLRRHGPLATHLSRSRQALHGLAAVAVTAGALLCFGATPLSAQDAGHVEADRLRADNAALRAELDDMRQMVEMLANELTALGFEGQVVGGAPADQADPARTRTADGGRQAHGRAGGRNDQRGPLMDSLVQLDWFPELQNEQTAVVTELNRVEQQLASKRQVEADVRASLAQVEALTGSGSREADELRSHLDMVTTERRSLTLRRDELQRTLDQIAVLADQARQQPDSGLAQLRALGYLAGAGQGDSQGAPVAEGHYLPGHPRFQPSQQGQPGGGVGGGIGRPPSSGQQGLTGAGVGLAGPGQQGLAEALNRQGALGAAPTLGQAFGAGRSGGSGGVVLDGALLDLVDRSLQARSELELMATEHARLQPLVDQGLASVHDLHGTESQLRTAEARLHILQTLVRGELGATEIELEQTVAQEPVDRARLMRLEARLDVLRTVL